MLPPATPPANGSAVCGLGFRVGGMAERGGLIEQVLGGEEAEGGEAEGGVAGLDPVAAAVAVGAAKSGEPLPAEVIAYFREQAHLVHIQTEHLHEQREVQLSHLKLRRFTDRLKAGTQLFIILVATVIGLGVCTMFYDAVNSRSVVVDAFKAPAVLAGRGVTGEVVAAGLLDGLQKLKVATHSASQGLGVRNAWSSDIKVEVPETGISIGEIDRLLHDRFGHDVHIGGDLVQTEGGGLALTVRGGEDVPAATFTGAAGELDKLTEKAAEYVYGRSQPRLYSAYLNGAGRDKDTLDFLPGAFARAKDDAERAALANSWGNAYADMLQPALATPKYRLVMSLSPPRSKAYWTGWGNLLNAVWLTQGEEAGWREGVAFLHARDAAPKKDQPRLRMVSNAATMTWDLPLLLASDLDDLAYNGGTNTSSDNPAIADVYGLMHDPAQVARYLAASDPADSMTAAETAVTQGYAALDHGDGAAGIAPLETFRKLWTENTTVKSILTEQICYLGLAYGLAGRAAEAEATFKLNTIPTSRCYGMHGLALAHIGDIQGAKRVWAEGVGLLPDLPNVYLYRGRWEMEAGDLRAAEADLATAATKAPHFADPWKGWGDLLAREGRWQEAVAKYDVALKSAPAWAELHRAREAAARR